MTTSIFNKDSNAVLDYAFDWSNWMIDGDSIVSHQITVNDPGLVVDSSSELNHVVTVWLSSGTAGIKYRVTCQITTFVGRIDERVMTIDVHS